MSVESLVTLGVTFAIQIGVIAFGYGRLNEKVNAIKGDVGEIKTQIKEGVVCKEHVKVCERISRVEVGKVNIGQEA